MTGQWEIQVSREQGRRITLQAGQQDVHLRLHPGESIRTPSTVLVQWSGPDLDTGHNMFRRLLVAYYLPRIAGQVAMPPVSATTAYVLLFDAVAKKTGKNPLDVLPTLTQDDLSPKHGMPTSDDALNAVDEQSQLDYISKMPAVGMEAFWLDAGWFPGGWPYGAGNWYPDPKKFPHGMKPIGDAAHQKGMKFLLWFEPGRVAPRTQIATQHPDWILHTTNDGKAGGRFYYGNPQARQWMTDLLSKCIDDWGIDIYRQDNNIFPLFFWRAADSPDRRGITENHDIEGMYAIWDELLRRHPKLEIDNANWQITGPDLETVKRTIGSLTRSEMSGSGIPDPMSDQLESADLSSWIPLHANLLHGLTPYSFQSTATTGVGLGLDLRSNYIPRDQLKLEIDRVKELRPFWLGDYYPLTALEFDQSKWCGWQFDRPDLSAGYAIFFRRPKSSASTFDAVLKGLDPQRQLRSYLLRSVRGKGKAGDDRRCPAQSSCRDRLCAGRDADPIPEETLASQAAATALGDLGVLTGRGHLSLFIAHYETHKIVAPLCIKFAFYVDAGRHPGGKCLVGIIQFDFILLPMNVLAIAIEEAEDRRQRTVAMPALILEPDRLQVEMSENQKL